MKYVFVWLITAVAAFGTNVGDTYEQVIAERGKPKSQASVGPNRILNYPEGSIQLRDNAVVLIKLPNTPTPKPAPAPAPATPEPAAEPEKPIVEPEISEQRIPVLENQRLSAINRAKTIINQPVKALKRTSAMRISTYPMWFHDGALTPDFNNVDVRKTQEFSYDKYEYVASDRSPDAVFMGRDLEFNSMTKYFYVDRSVPKKKLTEAEMVEINRLYRVIGKCDAQLKKLEAQAP